MSCKNILIIHYNTPELTEALVRSVNKFTPGCKIYIFDNSDVRPFTAVFDNVEIIDNTKGQLVNWEEWLNNFPDKYPSDGSNYGSGKHSYSVQLAFDLIPTGFVLLDSDVLLKHDISHYWDDKYIWVGQSQLSQKHYINVPRLLPYVCYINVPMCRKKKIRYFDGEHCWKLTRKKPERFYDTGAWFLRKTLGYPCKEVNIFDDIIHFGNGSWQKKQNYQEWLNENKWLWM